MKRSPVWWTRIFLSLLMRLHRCKLSFRKFLSLHRSLVPFLSRKILAHPCTNKPIRNRSLQQYSRMLLFRKFLKFWLGEWIQEQIVETIEVLPQERAKQIVHVPIPKIQEQSAVTGSVNPQFPVTAVDASQVVGSFSLSEEFAAPAEVTTLNTSSTSTSSSAPVYNRIRQKLFDETTQSPMEIFISSSTSTINDDVAKMLDFLKNIEKVTEKGCDAHQADDGVSIAPASNGGSGFCETPSTNTLHPVEWDHGKCSVLGSEYAARLIVRTVYGITRLLRMCVPRVALFVLSLLVAEKNRHPSFTCSPCTWRSRRLRSCPLLQREGLFVTSKRNCATSERITTQCINHEPRDENFITIGAERFRCTEVLLLPDFIGTGAAHYTTLLSRATWSATSTSAKSCTPCRAVKWHDHVPRNFCEHDKGIDGVVSIHDEVSGVCFTSVKGSWYGLEDLSCLPPEFCSSLFSSSPPWNWWLNCQWQWTWISLWLSWLMLTLVDWLFTVTIMTTQHWRKKKKDDDGNDGADDIDKWMMKDDGGGIPRNMDLCVLPEHDIGKEPEWHGKRRDPDTASSFWEGLAWDICVFTWRVIKRAHNRTQTHTHRFKETNKNLEM